MTHLVVQLTGSSMSDWNGFRVISAEDSEQENSEDLITSLKKLLASGYVLYHTAHGFHWNMKGEDFYEYHKLFLKIYEDIYESLDPIAENIVKLGGEAPFSMSELSNLSKIEEVNQVPKEMKELVETFQEMNNQFIKSVKKTFIIANDSNEQGVANFIAERIDQHQKWDWFLKASLGEK
jgi:starvation-inducible DNA-binding protein